MNTAGKLILIASFLIVLSWYFLIQKSPDSTPVPRAPVENSFTYRFDSQGTLFESANERESTSPYWWLDSGGLLNLNGGVGQTVMGVLEQENPWRKLYAASNPLDTEEGQKPQNIFRLITRSVWEDFTQEAYFYVDNYNTGTSVNRNESNGLLLMSRYRDSDNLYYAGLRVDGHVVVKKKFGGTYYTLAETPFITGNYNRETNPNLLPLREWIGLRNTIETLPDGRVKLTLFVNRNNGWVQAIEAIDTGEATPTITGAHHAGLRTDFMDVKFDNYEIREL